MASINKAIILGYVGDEPKITTTPAGKKVANLAIATTEKGYTSQSGVVYPDKTEWHNVTIWQKQAEFAEKFIKKGSLVYVEGKIKTRSYTKDNITRYATEIEAETLQLLDRKMENNANNTNVASAQGNKNDVPF